MKELLPSHNDIPSSDFLYASLNAESDFGSAYDVPRKAALAYSVPDIKKKREKLENKKLGDITIANPEETLMLHDFEGHYDIPKCKYTNETTTNNVSSLYDQPRFQFNHGEVATANKEYER